MPTRVVRDVVLGLNDTNVGGAATPTAAVSDASDATYVNVIDTSQLTPTRFKITGGAISTPTSQHWLSARLQSAGGYTIRFDVVVGATGRFLGRFEIAGLTGATTHSTASTSQPLNVTQDEINDIEILASVSALGGSVRVIELSWIFASADTPSFSVTVPRPTGTLTTVSNPEGSVSFGTLANTRIEYLRYVIATAAEYGVGGFDPATSPVTYRSPNLRTTDGWFRPPFLLPDDTSYRYYVQIAGLAFGRPSWPSTWLNTSFALNQTTVPVVSSVTATADAANGRMTVTVNRSTGGANVSWHGLWVQRSVDSGVTWTTVRGQFQAVATAADTHTVQDYEAPLGVACIYRALPIGPSGTTNRAGAWVSSSSATITSTFPWLTDVYTPSQSRPIRLADVPAWSRSFRHTKHEVIGQASPLIIPDARELDTGQLLVQTDTAAEAELLRTLTASQVLMVRFPPSYGDRDRYVFVSDSGTQRLGRLASIPLRRVPLTLVEISSPAEIPGFTAAPA